MMDLTEPQISALVALQKGLPLVSRPFKAIGEECGLSEEEIITLIKKGVASEDIRRLGGIFDARRIGFCSSLCYMDVPEKDLDRIAGIVTRVPGVTHAYTRGWPAELPKDAVGGPGKNHWPYFWFTLATDSSIFKESLEKLRSDCAPYKIQAMPAYRRFKIDVVFDLRTRERDEKVEFRPGLPVIDDAQIPVTPLSDRDRAIIALFQGHIEPCQNFFAEPARRVGITEEELLETLRKWEEVGVMRRLGILVFHRNMGFMANGMCCWNVPREEVLEKGRILSSSPDVTHCYERPYTEAFPFRLYAMIHRDSWEDAQACFLRLSKLAGLEKGQLLLSTREFKKTSMKFF